ncbi:MAG TPA: pyrimidine utilization protein A [Stellaceae bacterium]|nr:pyrimidine utilization protein A [Stellaceae bacterium]
MVKLGVFIPVGNNGWILSATSPQYLPTFELNRQVVQRAEYYGLDFVLSMIKFRGYGGPTQYWDYNLESFTLMAGLAAVTSRIALFASIAVLTMPPPVTARMAVTIDSIAPGRFGINIVTGWQKAEYEQMGVWPGDAYFGYRYDFASEYVQIMKELWSDGVSNFKGKHFQMDDCRLLPAPSGHIPIVSAGASARGMKFVAAYCDLAFTSAGVGDGLNQPRAIVPAVTQLREAAIAKGREIGGLVLLLIIADETDEAAMRKWEHYKEGADLEAMAWMGSQSAKDTRASANSTARLIGGSVEQRIPTALQTLCGSYATVARLLDEMAEIPGVAGIMMAFDDFLLGIEQFGTRIQPLMKSRLGGTVVD